MNETPYIEKVPAESSLGPMKGGDGMIAFPPELEFDEPDEGEELKMGIISRYTDDLIAGCELEPAAYLRPDHKGILQILNLIEVLYKMPGREMVKRVLEMRCRSWRRINMAILIEESKNTKKFPKEDGWKGISPWII
ncbi:MAG: hypothetical protein ACUVXI_19625 [bacterium]